MDCRLRYIEEVEKQDSVTGWILGVRNKGDCDSGGEKMFWGKTESSILDMCLRGSQDSQMESMEVSLIIIENETIEVNEIIWTIIKRRSLGTPKVEKQVKVEDKSAKGKRQLPERQENLLKKIFFKKFLSALGLLCCAQAFSSCGKRGLLFVVVRGLLTVVASLVAGHGLQVRRLQQLWRAGFSSCVTRPQQLWLMGLVAPRHVGSSGTRARTRVLCIGRRTLNHCATGEVLIGEALYNAKCLQTYGSN